MAVNNIQNKHGMRTIILLMITVFFVSCESKNNTEITSISGRNLLVNGDPYLIKGVCYHPVPIGSNQRDFNSLSEDLALMKEAGINTLRLYAPVDDKKVLDEIHDAGMKVIIGFGYHQNAYFDILSGTFIDYVNKYKNHPAILFWELGNEYNYHPEWFEGDIKNWYASLNKASDLIHQNDSGHPVATAHGELPDSLALSLCFNIDVWGMNVYRWDNPESIFPEWSAISTKPMYLSEAGADSYMTITKDGYEKGENEQAQADATVSILTATFGYQDICSGLTLFAFNDELWKAGNNDQYDEGGWAPNSYGVPYDGAPNEEYWGIVTIQRKKKLAFFEVKKIYQNLTNKDQ